MPQYDKGELKSILEKAVTHAQGWERDEVDANRMEALKYYLGKPRGDELPGRSQVQSMDVADMVNADLAQLTPMLSTDIFAAFEANGAEDEEQVESETRAVNKVIMEDEQGYVKFHIAIKDALLMRNGVIKVFYEEEVDVERFDYELDAGEMDQFIAFKEAELQPNQSVEEVSRDDGMLSLKVTTRKRSPRVCNVDPRNVLYTRNWDKQEIEDIPFFGERHFYTRSELVEMGFSKDEVDELPSDPPLYYPLRRDTTNDNYGFAPTADEIEVYECYIKVDQDGDGVAEQYRAYWCNNDMLGDLEPVPWIPYATGTAMLYPHEWMGESMFDRLKDVQDAKTSTVRQWLDNLANSNNARTAVDDTAVDPNHMLNTRPAGVIPVTGNPADHIMPLPIVDVGPSAQSLLDYYDKIRTERGGAALDMASAEAQIIGDTAHGVERQYSSKELTVQMYGKALAETLIRQVYVLMHRTLRVYMNEPISLKYAGQWTQVNPNDWQERTHLNVVVGQTAGQRNSAQQGLMMFIQMGMQLGQMAPGQIVDLGGMYKALQDWLKLVGVDNPDQYLIDPASPQAQQAAQQQQQTQQQQQQMQMQLYQMEKQLEKYQHDTELQFKYFDSILDADVKEGEVLVDAQIEAAKLASQDVNAEADRQSAPNGGGRDN